MEIGGEDAEEVWTKQAHMKVPTQVARMAGIMGARMGVRTDERADVLKRRISH
jgi:hypothetical protein